MKAPQGWTPSQKTGEKYLAYLYHSFMHGPEGIYQANYRLDGSVHFQRFLYALYVWSGCFGTEDLFFFAMVALKVNYRDL